MKAFFLLGAAALTLSGCTSTKCDTGDSSCGSSDLYIEAVDGTCAGTTCTWSVQVNGEFGNVDLDLAETGDTTSPQFWEEYHNAFTTSDFNDPGEAAFEEKSINLTLVASYEDVVSNETTIFDVSSAEISNQLTVMFTVYDTSGAYLDCVTYGNDPSYYSAYCSNVW